MNQRISGNIFPSYRIDDLVFRAIYESEISDAQRILYTTYVVEEQWDIPTGNPSVIRTFSGTKGSELTDNFKNKAIWFGAFREHELIACFRVLNNNSLELAHYIDLPEDLKRESSELNRLAILESYRNHRKVCLMLLRTAFDYAFSLGPIAYVTAESPDPSGMFQRMGLLKYNYAPFKYDSSDPNYVDILYYDTNKHNRFLTTLYKLTDKFLI